MAVAGIDVGSVSISVVILQDNEILYHSVIQSGEGGTAASERAMAEALKRVALSVEDITFTIATGCGRRSVSLAQKGSAEVVCQARGALWLFPSARTVINLGAESSRAIRLNEQGRVQSFVTNDKCAAGSGLFLESMSNLLGVPLAKMGELALRAERQEEVSSRCAVFAESEVISHIHRGVPKEHILAGLHKAVVDRILEIASRVGIEKDVVITGGVAKNTAIIKELGERMGLPMMLPKEPQIVGALGAALIARDNI
ncbi:MAG: 2-hydroxyglutaryl-CoA dehydratase [Dehalococcoidia bacterium]|nr:2-hydroxyglutaryl-CoA dehydratase [Dehalococcoidia bacterium]